MRYFLLLLLLTSCKKPTTEAEIHNYHWFHGHIKLYVYIPPISEIKLDYHRPLNVPRYVDRLQKIEDIQPFF